MKCYVTADVFDLCCCFSGFAVYNVEKRSLIGERNRANFLQKFERDRVCHSENSLCGKIFSRPISNDETSKLNDDALGWLIDWLAHYSSFFFPKKPTSQTESGNQIPHVFCSRDCGCWMGLAEAESDMLVANADMAKKACKIAGSQSITNCKASSWWVLTVRTKRTYPCEKSPTLRAKRFFSEKNFVSN